ncbi:MAG: hypothetical protein ACLQVI_43405 [Polyangiaceae bacterium]|jgi:hypothetical protein
MMAKDLQLLRERCLTMLEFIERRAIPGQPNFGNQFRTAIEQTFERGDSRGMKKIASEFSEWARGLSPLQRTELDNHLRDRFGTGLREDDEATRSKVERVISNGRIANQREYSLLSDLRTQVETNGSDSAHRKIDEMLTEYQLRKAPKAKRKSRSG